MPLTLYATSRRGEDLGIVPKTMNMEVRYSKLDIGSGESIEALASGIKDEHGVMDVLINNGAFHPGRQTTVEGAKKTLDVNYKGTLAVRLVLCMEDNRSLTPLDVPSFHTTLAERRSHCQRFFHEF